MNPEVWPPEAEIKAKYMAFHKLEWALFCDHIGMDSHVSRGIYPLMKWRREKIQMWGEKRGEELAARIFEAQYDWHNQVLKTMKEYPETADFIHFILKQKLQVIAKKGDMGEGKFDATKVNISQVQKIANTLATVAETKISALQITKWNMDIAQSKAEEFFEESSKDANPMKILVAGKGEMTIEEIQQLHDQWMDKPNESDPVPDNSSNK